MWPCRKNVRNVISTKRYRHDPCRHVSREGNNYKCGLYETLEFRWSLSPNFMANAFSWLVYGRRYCVEYTGLSLNRNKHSTMAQVHQVTCISAQTLDSIGITRTYPDLSNCSRYPRSIFLKLLPILGTSLKSGFEFGPRGKWSVPLKIDTENIVVELWIRFMAL